MRLCDELGYDYFFTTEHHFTKNFSLAPSQPVTLAVVAQNSQRMRFGPMVLQLPISEPLRVLEEMIILDHMSGGRLDIGLGQGVSPHEHITYGIDTHMSLDRFKEALEVVVSGLTADGPFSYSGQFWDYVDVDLPWRPLQRPHPPIWVPTSSVDRGYEYGLRGFGTGGFALVGLDRCEQVFREYRRGCDEAHTPPEQRSMAYLATTLVADTDTEATALMYEHLTHQLALFEEERRRTLQMGGPSVERINLAALRRLDAMRADMDKFADGAALRARQPRHRRRQDRSPKRPPRSQRLYGRVLVRRTHMGTGATLPRTVHGQSRAAVGVTFSAQTSSTPEPT